MLKEILITKKYINYPVRNNHKKSRVTIKDHEVWIQDFVIELATQTPDLYVHTDLSKYIGKKLTFIIDETVDEDIFDSLIQTDEIMGAEDIYNEELRPLIHFTAKKGWFNDPNGLIYYEGEYHRFYQHNPYGIGWENMNWGHSVSTDLLHWEEIGIALTPPYYGDHCYSGSAVIDHHNTLGLNKDGKPPMVAVYTSTGRGECLAISHDKGRTWSEHDKNPVLVHGLISKIDLPNVPIFHNSRDPKVFFWNQSSHEWVMIVFDEFSLDDLRREDLRLTIYTSPNLVNWEKQSDLNGWFECPDLFELPVDGDPNNKKWVVMAADGGYALGQFDGKQFDVETRESEPFDPYTADQNRRESIRNESYKYNGFYGDLYAAQTFDNIPEQDGRRIYIGWLPCKFEGMPFCNSMSLPLELSLRTTDDGIRLFFEPVKEIEALYTESQNHIINSPGELTVIEDTSMQPLDLIFELQENQAKGIEIEINGVKIYYDKNKQKLICYVSDSKKIEAPLKGVNGEINLRIIVDRQIIEIFGNHGRVYMPVGIPNDRYDNKFALRSSNQHEELKVMVKKLKKTVFRQSCDL